MSNKFLIVCGGAGVHLLGQRRLLGLDGELQLDVREEIIVEKSTRIDAASSYVALDKNVGPVSTLLNELSSQVADNHDNNTVSEYLSSSIVGEKAQANYEFLRKHTRGNIDLKAGLAQAPAIGKAAILHKQNRKAVTQKIDDMFQHGTNVGPENPVEVWIVSSTAGGTGEGIHRFAGALVAEYMRRNYERTPLELKFIRVGPLTYRSVNKEKVDLNSFFGISADAAYLLKISDDLDTVSTSWYYLDLPDVGTGEEAKHVRAEIVEMAAKSVMLDDLQKPLQKLLVNNRGAPMVIIRTGYWGADFSNSLKYFQTIKQLITKLKELINPDYERMIEDSPHPRLNATDLDRIQTIDTNLIIEKKEEGWQFPKYPSSKLQSIDDTQELLRRWENAIDKLFEMDISTLDVHYWVDKIVQTEEGRQRQSVQLSVPASMDRNKNWYSGIKRAHLTKAWSQHLLGVNDDGEILSEGFLRKLLESGQRIAKHFHSFNPFLSDVRRARKASAELHSFIERYLQVNHLLGLRREASRLLQEELLDAKNVLRMCSQEVNILKEMIGTTASRAVTAANLSTVLDHVTQRDWLQLLTRAARKGDRNQFKKTVIKGATGLTESGLKDVLGLSSTAEVEDIQNELSSSMGKMYDDDGETHEGPWWAATEPISTLSYNYRILPKVDKVFEEKLLARAEEHNPGYSYIFTDIGVIGLYVLAFLGVSLNQESGDMTTTPAFLLKPLVSSVTTALEKWKNNPIPNVPSGQLDIVSAGTIGAPLYERAMREAGLDDGAIEKISQFYKLYQ